VYKADLKVRGKWLTVHFSVDRQGRSRYCRKCGYFSNEGGAVRITEIVQNGVDVWSHNPAWAGAQSRLDKLFGLDLCVDHLDEEANRRNITLD